MAKRKKVMATMYAEIIDNIVTQYPLTVFQVRAMYPEVSWPDAPNEEALAQYNLYTIWPVNPPKIRRKLTLIEGTPEFDVTANRWEQVWIVT